MTRRSTIATTIYKSIEISIEYRDFVDVFNATKYKNLLSYRDSEIDFRIEIKLGKTLSNKPVYSYSDAEL